MRQVVQTRLMHLAEDLAGRDSLAVEAFEDKLPMRGQHSGGALNDLSDAHIEVRG